MQPWKSPDPHASASQPPPTALRVGRGKVYVIVPRPARRRYRPWSHVGAIFAFALCGAGGWHLAANVVPALSGWQAFGAGAVAVGLLTLAGTAFVQGRREGGE